MNVEIDLEAIRSKRFKGFGLDSPITRRTVECFTINGSNETHECESLRLSHGHWIADEPSRFCHIEISRMIADEPSHALYVPHHTLTV